MKTVALGEVADVNPKAPRIPGDVEVSFVGMVDLNAVSAETQSVSVRRYAEVSKGYTTFRNGDVLVAKITPCFENNKIGQARLQRDIGGGSTEFHVVRPGKHLDARYVLHMLRQDCIRHQGELRMTGSAGQRRVPADFLKQLKIPLPPLDEQRRIATILDQADGLREKNDQRSASLSELADAIFLNMFDDPEAALASGSVVRLGDVADLQGGRNLVAGDQDVKSEFRVLKISAVTSGKFRPSESKALPAGYHPPADHLVRQGDLLISRANTSELVGAVAYVEDAPSNLVLPDKIWRFVWRSHESVPLYYRTLFRTSSVRRRMSQLASGTGGSMKNISKAKLVELELPKVEFAQQREFASRVTAIPRTAPSQFDELFVSLQSRAFSGQL